MAVQILRFAQDDSEPDAARKTCHTRKGRRLKRGAFTVVEKRFVSSEIP